MSTADLQTMEARFQELAPEIRRGTPFDEYQRLSRKMANAIHANNQPKLQRVWRRLEALKKLFKGFPPKPDDVWPG